MAKAIEGGHFNEAFEHEPSSNNLEKKVEASESQGQQQNSDLKWKILKNVLLISVAFMVLFTSYQSMSTLQSSINKARASKQVSIKDISIGLLTYLTTKRGLLTKVIKQVCFSRTFLLSLKVKSKL